MPSRPVRLDEIDLKILRDLQDQGRMTNVELARRAGISSLEVANSLQAYIDGIKASEYREGDQAIPIVLQSVEEERAEGSDFYSIRVGAADEVPVRPQQDRGAGQ